MISMMQRRSLDWTALYPTYATCHHCILRGTWQRRRLTRPGGDLELRPLSAYATCHHSTSRGVIRPVLARRMGVALLVVWALLIQIRRARTKRLEGWPSRGERQDEYCLRPPVEAAGGAGGQEGHWPRLPAGPTQSPGDAPTPTASNALTSGCRPRCTAPRREPQSWCATPFVLNPWMKGEASRPRGCILVLRSSLEEMCTWRRAAPAAQREGWALRVEVSFHYLGLR